MQWKDPPFSFSSSLSPPPFGSSGNERVGGATGQQGPPAADTLSSFPPLPFPPSFFSLFGLLRRFKRIIRYFTRAPEGPEVRGPSRLSLPSFPSSYRRSIKTLNTIFLFPPLPFSPPPPPYFLPKENALWNWQPNSDESPGGSAKLLLPSFPSLSPSGRWNPYYW